MENKLTCKVIRPGDTFEAKQGLTNSIGISADSVGAKSLHMHHVYIPPNGKAKAHKHAGHESAIFALEGRSGCWFGDELESHTFVEKGEYFFIPADVPHLPYNPSTDEMCVVVVARSDPNEQESVVMLPHLDSLPHVQQPF